MGHFSGVGKPDLERRTHVIQLINADTKLLRTLHESDDTHDTKKSRAYVLANIRSTKSPLLPLCCIAPSLRGLDLVDLGLRLG